MGVEMYCFALGMYCFALSMYCFALAMYCFALTPMAHSIIRTCRHKSKENTVIDRTDVLEVKSYNSLQRCLIYGR